VNANNDFKEMLLRQGPQLSPDQYAEYRRRLDDRLAGAAREERSMRRIVYLVCGLAGALWLLGWDLILNNNVEILSGLIGGLLLVAGALLPILAGYALLLYCLKYRPNLKEAQQQEQRALLLDVQHQLNELREQQSRPKV
jgi:hypothetical protein